MKLKTLKDLEIVLIEENSVIKEMIDLLDLVDGEKHNPIVYSQKDLRQEAIKWIKELNVIPKIIKGKQGYQIADGLVLDIDEAYGVWKFLRYFFNIPDEYLIENDKRLNKKSKKLN